MIKVKKLTEEGRSKFREWLEGGGAGTPPALLLDSSDFTASSADVEIDEARVFKSHLEFGKYLSEAFDSIEMRSLLDASNDGMWDWLAMVYFAQLAKAKPLKYWHYIVERKGLRGSLAYRQMVRTSYELYVVHGDGAKVCLDRPMDRWGEMSEQLTSRQSIARHRGFMDVADALYIKADGKVRRGATAKPLKVAKRKAGEKKGFGGARRLAVALERLDRVWDTEIMQGAELLPTLPAEFSKWTSGPP